jgi:hypothetical protein
MSAPPVFEITPIQLGKARRIPGEAGKSPEYAAWNGLVTRCTCPKDKRYPRYGGRGITVCDRWRHDYDAFLFDMGRRPGPGYSLERKKNNGPYAPDNCIWGTKKEQQRNRRDSTFLTFEGHTANSHYWAEEMGIPHQTLRGRLARGWPVERALRTRSG